MNTIETFKEFIPIYEQIKDLTIEGKSLECFLSSFINKYKNNIIDGKYVTPVIDLSKCIDNLDLKAEENTRYFIDLLCDRIDENTPHGEHGVTEYSEVFLIYGKKYKITISGVQWNRYDKQYYYIDNYTQPTIEIKGYEET